MDLNTFIKLYQDFLHESERKGWFVEILKAEFGNHLASIESIDGIKVRFFIELDYENRVQLDPKTSQSQLNYGVIRQEGIGDPFAKEVLDAFHQFCSENTPKRKATFFIFKP